MSENKRNTVEFLKWLGGEKKELDRQINQALMPIIAEYTEKTGCIVTGVDIDRVEITDFTSVDAREYTYGWARSNTEFPELF